MHDETKLFLCVVLGGLVFAATFLVGCSDAPHVNGVYLDREKDPTTATIVLKGGLTRGDVNPNVHGETIKRLASLPDGAVVTLRDNGVSILSDRSAAELIAAKKLRLVCAERSGCDGTIIWSRSPRAPNPGALG